MANIPTILIVEDEASAIFALDKYFSNNGFAVLKAFSAQEGLKTALENHPDVIILDVIMPSSSGLDILPELRSNEWGKNAKVVVFSNLSSEEQKATARKFHVEDYLIKTDTSLKQLEERIKQILPANAS